MGGGRVMVQLRGTDGLFSMQSSGLAGSKLLWCTEAGEAGPSGTGLSPAVIRRIK